MIGRDEQLTMLQKNYASDQNNLTILYGRRGIGKTTLLCEFMKEKECAYYEAGACADFEQISSMSRCFDVPEASDYDEIFDALIVRGIRLFIVEEFQNLVKADSGFMSAITYLLKNSNEKIMIVCTCSSVSWVENSMVRAIGTAAFSINTFMKLRELTYVDMVSLFPNCDAQTILSVYAVTGGVPGYVRLWDAKLSERENICRLVLADHGALTAEAERYVGEEFRESGVYNTILGCLASGKNKLNEIHEYTGYGRDKISVYLKNLIEREIVEKVFSYDVTGNENTRKGLYRIREGYLRFWFGYVYPHAGIRAVTGPEEFFDRYVAADLSRNKLDAYIQVAGEFLEIMGSMGRLPWPCERKGGWHGKKGDLHLIFSSEDGKVLVGNAFVKQELVSLSDFEHIKQTAELAGMVCEHFYLFSVAGFSEELKKLESEQLVLVDIQDL